jgi:Mrp family chromosome partitioning ATPase/DUF971 family protein
MASEKQILEALSHIMDPDLGRDIVSLGFVKNIKIEGPKVSFDLELTTPACPVRDRFKQQAEQAVRRLPGVEAVNVNMTAMSRPQHAHAHAPQPETSALDDVQSIIAVSSCKGGVGKSTVAAHLARALRREGLQVGLLDADLYGPSFPTLFNLHRPDVYMHENRIIPLEHEGIKIMSFGFLLGDAPAVLRGPIVSGYIQQLLTQTDWGCLDYLIIDLPPGTGDIQLTLTQIASMDGALIVTTPHTLSLVDVAKGIMMFEKVDVPVLGLVENMSYFTCDGCGKQHRLFGSSTRSLSDRFGIETLAEIPLIPGVSKLDSDAAGQIQDAMDELARNLHRAVGRRRIETVRPTVTSEEDGLRVKWPNGTESKFSFKSLRSSCGCAECVDEYTGERHAIDPATLADAQIESIQPLGNYAVSVTWNDGHTSIYPWKEMESLAQ